MALRDKPLVLRRPMRVEFWLASNTNSLIYRMLVLNTVTKYRGTERRQIEVIHKSLIKELRTTVQLNFLRRTINVAKKANFKRIG